MVVYVCNPSSQEVEVKIQKSKVILSDIGSTRAAWDM